MDKIKTTYYTKERLKTVQKAKWMIKKPGGSDDFSFKLCIEKRTKSYPFCAWAALWNDMFLLVSAWFHFPKLVQTKHRDNIDRSFTFHKSKKTPIMSNQK